MIQSLQPNTWPCQLHIHRLFPIRNSSKGIKRASNWC
jgi:hypothetical protein